MFFNQKKKIAKQMVDTSNLIAISSLNSLIKDDQSIKIWLIRDQADADDWDFFATIACTFLALQTRERDFSGAGFSKLADAAYAYLGEWNKDSPRAMYDL
ncbi:MAG: hypothetical protein IH614_09135 [Desulfuromonadales bacterium]|nr:hypothetical protein [Desulfuromonadales bacterium]